MYPPKAKTTNTLPNQNQLMANSSPFDDNNFSFPEESFIRARLGEQTSNRANSVFRSGQEMQNTDTNMESSNSFNHWVQSFGLDSPK